MSRSPLPRERGVPAADLVLVADNDEKLDRNTSPGIEAARKAALAVDARLAMEPEPIRVWPSAAAITRLELTFDWVLWIEEAERKLVLSQAARVPWKQINRELGFDRTTAWRRWQLALTKIAARLNAD